MEKEGWERGLPLDLDVMIDLVQEALEGVADFRSKRGRRYELGKMLGLVVIGLASGCNSLAEVGRFGKRRPEVIRGLGLGRAPSHATLWRAVTGVKQERLREALRRVGGEVLVALCECAVAFDGKTMRSSRRADGGQACLVSGCEQSTGAVVDTVMVKRGGSELTAGREAVKRLIRKHRQVSVITGDALYADRVLAGFIEKSGRDYVLKVKKINLSS